MRWNNTKWQVACTTFVQYWTKRTELRLDKVDVQELGSAMPQLLSWSFQEVGLAPQNDKEKDTIPYQILWGMTVAASKFSNVAGPLGTFDTWMMRSGWLLFLLFLLAKYREYRQYHNRVTISQNWSSLNLLLTTFTATFNTVPVPSLTKTQKLAKSTSTSLPHWTIPNEDYFRKSLPFEKKKCNENGLSGIIMYQMSLHSSI